MSSRRPGRPTGRSDKGRAREAHLYGTALRLFAEQGYAQTTLRQIAREAGVSPGLVYRYFDAKQAIVLRLYTELSTTYADRVGTESQPWAVGVSAALREIWQRIKQLSANTGVDDSESIEPHVRTLEWELRQWWLQ